MKQPTPSSILAPDDASLNVFRHLPDYKLLMRANGPDFTIIDITETYRTILGLGRDRICGHPYLEVFARMPKRLLHDDAAVLIKHFQQVRRTKKMQVRHVFRHDIPDPDDPKATLEYYWRVRLYPIFGDAGEVTHILQVLANVTQEVVASRDLQEARFHLEEALEAGKVGTWTWDVSTNVVVGNVGMANLFHTSVETAQKGVPLNRYLRMIHVEDRDRLTQALQNATEANSSFDIEFRVGSGPMTRWVISRGRMMSYEGTKRFSGVIVDVTERRDLQAQVELARQQDRLNRAEARLLQQRNEELQALSRTKEEFVALASHQLRTPATAVKQYLGMVLQGYAGETTQIQSEMLAKAFESNERQIEIINQILNAARADTGKLNMTPAPFDIRAMLKGIMDEQRALLKSHEHYMTIHLPRHPFIYHGDHGYLRMAIENLISNADKYTPSKGTITVALRVAKNEIAITVADTGVGIPESDLDKLFVKFSRIHNSLSVSAGGSGIGLYLAAEIIKLHGGTIGVKSTPSHGTTFTIRLPLLEK